MLEEKNVKMRSKKSTKIAVYMLTLKLLQERITNIKKPLNTIQYL